MRTHRLSPRPSCRRRTPRGRRGVPPRAMRSRAGKYDLRHPQAAAQEALGQRQAGQLRPCRWAWRQDQPGRVGEGHLGSRVRHARGAAIALVQLIGERDGGERSASASRPASSARLEPQHRVRNRRAGAAGAEQLPRATSPATQATMRRKPQAQPEYRQLGCCGRPLGPTIEHHGVDRPHRGGLVRRFSPSSSWNDRLLARVGDVQARDYPSCARRQSIAAVRWHHRRCCSDIDQLMSAAASPAG